MDLTGAQWRKSSYSSNGGATCVEAAMVGAVVAVRDSTDPDGPKLAFTGREWDAFLTRVKDQRLPLS